MYEFLGSIVLSVIFGIWVYLDSKKRKNDTIKWTLGTLLLTPFVVPNYFAKRNLKEEEIRRGGSTWHALKNFALFWSLYMLYVTFFTSLSELSLTTSTGDEAFGLFGLILLWGVPAGGAFLLGIFLRKPSKVEEGPTGSLAQQKN